MVNSRKVEDLFPPVRRAALELKRRMKDLGYDLGFSSTFRDFESQNALYAQGRTKKGRVVTNARGGQSYHNYKLAFDIFQNIRGKEYDLKFLNIAGKIGQEMGLEWGGSWKGFVDTPHFQWSDGLTISDLRKGKYPKDKKLKWEVISKEVKEAKEVKENIIKVDEIILEIDGKEYKVKRILNEGFNYISLRDFVQAGYSVGYNGKSKMPMISKPEK